VLKRVKTSLWCGQWSGCQLVEFPWTLTTSWVLGAIVPQVACRNCVSSSVLIELIRRARRSESVALAVRRPKLACNISNNAGERPTIGVDVSSVWRHRRLYGTPPCDMVQRGVMPPSLPCFMLIAGKVIQGQDSLGDRLSGSTVHFLIERRRSDASQLIAYQTSFWNIISQPVHRAMASAADDWDGREAVEERRWAAAMKRWGRRLSTNLTQCGSTDRRPMTASGEPTSSQLKWWIASTARRRQSVNEWLQSRLNAVTR